MKFNEWFTNQFGKCDIDCDEYFELKEKRISLKEELGKVEEKIKQMDEISMYKKAALYAWNIKDNDKR